MKKTFTLTEPDIKAVIAEKFKVDPNDVKIFPNFDLTGGEFKSKLIIKVESEVQNYDI